jgi:hypothetical protein
MPLTVRTNGSGGSNIITQDWFNDFLKLLTGVMTDQEVVIKNNLVLQGISAAPSVQPTAVLGGTGGSLSIGTYKWAYTWVSPDGETLVSPVSATVTTTSSNKTGALSAIAAGPTGTTGRNLYRSAVGAGALKFLTLIADNTTTVYTDVIADASLGAAPPTAPSFGGSLVIKNPAGTVQFKINNDGTFIGAGGGGSSLSIVGTLSVTGLSTLQGGIAGPGGASTLNIDSAGTGPVQFLVNGVNIFQATASGPGLNSGKSYNLQVGSLSRMSIFQVTVTNSAVFYNHGLGVIPDAILFVNSSLHTTVLVPTYEFSSMTSTQVKMQANGSVDVTAIAIKF